MDRITARYLVETPLPLERAARSLASEQSSGTFVALPGETESLLQRFAARLEAVHPLKSVTTPSLPGSRPPSGTYQRGELVISWPAENVGLNLPTLLSTLQGNLYELAQFSGLRLIDFDLPADWGSAFPGPRQGVAGTRRLTGVADRPLLGTIIKPSIGLSPGETAAIVDQLISAGIDFIKDDELMANPAHSPLKERIRAVMPVIERHADRTGRKVMYAFNLSDGLEAMLANYDFLVEAGGTCAMLSLNSVGLAAVHRLCGHGTLAIHGHRNGWGMLNRHPFLGMDFQAYQKIWRLAGVDQLHVNGIGNKFWEPDESVVHSMACCRAPFLGQQPILPVVSSGQWGGQAFETWRRTRTVDLLYMAGGGIMAHPGGPAGGVAAIRQAWDGAVAGSTLEETAARHPELAEAVAKFSAPPA